LKSLPYTTSYTYPIHATFIPPPHPTLLPVSANKLTSHLNYSNSCASVLYTSLVSFITSVTSRCHICRVLFCTHAKCIRLQSDKCIVSSVSREILFRLPARCSQLKHTCMDDMRKEIHLYQLYCNLSIAIMKRQVIYWSVKNIPIIYRPFKTGTVKHSHRPKEVG